ncbi:sulfurtransferase TusA family protein [Sansalvadorimonas sp. 2012CJ34-2]|uniref:Sulfurtransferase TusA family protein n=1 Tax=Parendozoicomonas callyspongiae TaxID=2942213 RepID=A0ABT0PFV1_9GAMM|nr:sulfurtransferase TusA family protein [Sansalvadorimonas sp. 2012CJ34-2]MCL6270249.1 sulfurtransferase TusA family protein [Sansalvadorimonas sp. 2012CJ34-2]
MLELDQDCRELDARGLDCPMPLLKAKQALNGMEPREVLKVLATDPGSVRDFASFAELAGHELLFSGEESGVFTHILKKHG